MSATSSTYTVVPTSGVLFVRPRMFERRRPLLALGAVRVEGCVARRFGPSIREGRWEIML